MLCIILNSVSQRSVFEIAALASAAMPELSVATTRGSEQFFMSGEKKDITTAVITSVEGVEYDVSVSSSDESKSILKDRAKAAYVLSHSKTAVGLSFALESYTLFVPGEGADSSTGTNAVYITPHIDGDAVALKNLTSEQCAAAGTAIAAIHRLRGGFLRAAKYRSYTAESIQKQLTGWMHSLESAGHIPSEIIHNWKNIIATEGLWNFTCCPVHGGFHNGDLIFMSDSVNALRHWENMQISDPARDLAWIYTHLNKAHRDSFIAAYSRVMGNRLDNMIWLRAGLWTQMEQVGEYMRALTQADTAKILAFKSQVNSLAHQIARNNPKRQPIEKKTTLTVGDLLENPQAAQGKAETRVKGGTSQKPAGHTRFIADSGMRSGDIAQAPQRAEMSSDSTDNAVNLHASQSQAAPLPPQSAAQSPRKNWNVTPRQSENFSYSSDNQHRINAQDVADSLEAPVVSNVSPEVEEHLNSATIAMQSQSAAAAAQHAQEGLTYTSQRSYMAVNSMGFVMDSSHSTNVNDEEDDSGSGESEIIQDDIETTVFTAQENTDGDSDQQVD